jgi:hypothetical protein
MLNTNQTFQSSSSENEPYYTISAQLDLTQLGPETIIYFNRENNRQYLNLPNPDEYGGFYTIDQQSVIGEVVVYSNPDLVYSGLLSELEFQIGGAYKPSVTMDSSIFNITHRQSIDIWGGPTGNHPSPITASQLYSAQVCHYGRTPEFPTSAVYEPEWGIRKYLALKCTLNPDQPRLQRSPEHQVRWMRKRAQMREWLGSRDLNQLSKGQIYVVIKVYPKFETVKA